MKILFTSVFKPYGVDDKYGRKSNRMELFHNQITREQGIFSLRRNHRSFNLYLLAENINVPSTVLDFPSLKDFIRELKKGYDYIGISFITPNFAKTKKMAGLIRKYAPKSKIILGGHGTQIPDLEQIIDCDYIVKGEGISWLRRFFGEPVDAPIKHPILPSADHQRFMGLPLASKSIVLLPGVGCANSCRFCSTTHLFKFKYIPFLKTARDLFAVMEKAEKEQNCEDFSIMDENFLKSKERAVELLSLMKKHDKHYYFAIFSSAETIIDLGVKFLFELGVRHIWIGVESQKENYEKNKDIDMKRLFADLKNHGISILASTILFQEHHTKETIWEDIDYTLDLQPDFTQFMQLGPLPQTVLYNDYKKKGLLREDIPYEDWHGQHRLWFRHPHFTAQESETYLRKAFQKDYHELGPSVLRACNTFMQGYLYTRKYCDNPWMKMRNDQLREQCRQFYPFLNIMRPYLPNTKSKHYARTLGQKYKDVFGAKTFRQKLLGQAAHICALKEALKLKFFDDTRQPKTIYAKYHRPPFQLFPEMLPGKAIAELSTNFLKIKLDYTLTGHNLCLELHGILDSINVDELLHKISGFFKREPGNITLNLTKLHKIEDNSLYKLIVKLEQFHSRIRLEYSKKMEDMIHIIEGTNLSVQCVAVCD